MTYTNGESLIIAWQDPREFRMRDSEIQWAKDVKKEIKSTKGRRGQWAFVLAKPHFLESRVEFYGKKDAARKVFGWSHVHWDIHDDKLYVRVPWWKL